MEDFLQKLEQLKDQIVWDEERKGAVRMQLAVAMREQPLIPASHWSVLGFISSWKFKVMFTSTIVIVFIISGIGVSFAAQNSLPGNVLYPIKVGINEPARSLFATTPEAKASLNMEFAQTRLQEAEKLAIIGKLSDKIRTNLEQSLDNHINQVANNLAQVKAEHGDAAAASVASDFETSLTVQSDILSNLNGASEGGSQVAQLEQSVKGHLSNARDGRVELDNTLTGVANGNPALKILASNKLQAATKAAFDADSYITKIDLSPSAEDAARSRLELAKQIISAGQDKLANGYYGEAFTLANKALRTVAEAKALAKAQTDLKVNLHLENSDLFQVKGESDSRQRGNQLQQDINSGKLQLQQQLQNQLQLND